MAPKPLRQSLRVATLSDVSRIGLVAASGFFHSPVFTYERPSFDQFPGDTLASYYAEYQKAILDHDSIVLVAEDRLDCEEAKKAYRAIQDISSTTLKNAPKTDSVIVGVASFTLSSESPQRERVQPRASDGAPATDYTLATKRDQSQEATSLYKKHTTPAAKRWLKGCMTLNTLAVHPAYWKRGHGSRLIQWGCALADRDGVEIGVAAAKMGVRLYQKAGFEEKEIVKVEPSKSHEAIDLWYGIRPATPYKGTPKARSDCA